VTVVLVAVVCGKPAGISGHAGSAAACRDVQGVQRGAGGGVCRGGLRGQGRARGDLGPGPRPDRMVAGRGEGDRIGSDRAAALPPPQGAGRGGGRAALRRRWRALAGWRSAMPRLPNSDTTISSTPVSRRCRFFTICGSNVPARSRGTSIPTGPVLPVSTVFGLVPFRTFPRPAPWPAGSCFLIPPVAGHLLVQRGLDHGLGQLLQQPVRAGQRQAPLAGQPHQLPRSLSLSGYRAASWWSRRPVSRSSRHLSHQTLRSGVIRPETPLDPQTRPTPKGGQLPGGRGRSSGRGKLGRPAPRHDHRAICPARDTSWRVQKVGEIIPLTGLLAWPFSWLEMAVAVPSRLACRVPGWWYQEVPGPCWVSRARWAGSECADGDGHAWGI
jgi:hypothetical protein